MLRAPAERNVLRELSERRLRSSGALIGLSDSTSTTFGPFGTHTSLAGKPQLAGTTAL